MLCSSSPQMLTCTRVWEPLTQIDLPPLFPMDRPPPPHTVLSKAVPSSEGHPQPSTEAHTLPESLSIPPFLYILFLAHPLPNMRL